MLRCNTANLGSSLPLGGPKVEALGPASLLRICLPPLALLPPQENFQVAAHGSSGQCWGVLSAALRTPSSEFPRQVVITPFGR